MNHNIKEISDLFMVGTFEATVDPKNRLYIPSDFYHILEALKKKEICYVSDYTFEEPGLKEQDGFLVCPTFVFGTKFEKYSPYFNLRKIDAKHRIILPSDELINKRVVITGHIGYFLIQKINKEQNQSN